MAIFFRNFTLGFIHAKTVNKEIKIRRDYKDSLITIQAQIPLKFLTPLSFPFSHFIVQAEQNHDLSRILFSQFHQVSGQGFDRFLNIFGEMGINVSPVAKKYNAAINDFFDTEVYTRKYPSRSAAEKTGGGPKLKSSAQIVYAYAARQMKEALEDPEPNASKQKFADYIIFGLSRNVNTELVKFVGKGIVKTRVANREFRDVLVNSTYSVSVNASGDPKIIISLGSKKLLQIRYKLEVASGRSGGQKVYRFYPRHYLEALEGMFTI